MTRISDKTEYTFSFLSFEKNNAQTSGLYGGIIYNIDQQKTGHILDKLLKPSMRSDLEVSPDWGILLSFNFPSDNRCQGCFRGANYKAVPP